MGLSFFVSTSICQPFPEQLEDQHGEPPYPFKSHVPGLALAIKVLAVRPLAVGFCAQGRTSTVTDQYTSKAEKGLDTLVDLCVSHPLYDQLACPYQRVRQDFLTPGTGRHLA